MNCDFFFQFLVHPFYILNGALLLSTLKHWPIILLEIKQVVAGFCFPNSPRRVI